MGRRLLLIALIRETKLSSWKWTTFLVFLKLLGSVNLKSTKYRKVVNTWQFAIFKRVMLCAITYRHYLDISLIILLIIIRNYLSQKFKLLSRGIWMILYLNMLFHVKASLELNYGQCTNPPYLMLKFNFYLEMRVTRIELLTTLIIEALIPYYELSLLKV